MSSLYMANQFTKSVKLYIVSQKTHDFIDYPRNGVAYNFRSVCLSVCLYVCQMITFESLHVGSSYLHIRCISREHRSSLYMKVIGSRSRSRSQELKKFANACSCTDKLPLAIFISTR